MNLTRKQGNRIYAASVVFASLVIFSSFYSVDKGGLEQAFSFIAGEVSMSITFYQRVSRGCSMSKTFY